MSIILLSEFFKSIAAFVIFLNLIYSDNEYPDMIENILENIGNEYPVIRVISFSSSSSVKLSSI